MPKLFLSTNDFIKGNAIGKYIGDGFFYTNNGVDVFRSRGDYGILRQGVGLTDLSTNVSDEIKWFINHGNYFYGFGANGYLYKINITTQSVSVLDSGNESGRTGGRGLINYYDGSSHKLHYFSNTACGTYDYSSTFNNSAYTGLENAPHPAIVWQGILYFANGRYIGTINGTTLTTNALTLPNGYEVKDIDVLQNYIAIIAEDTTNTYLNEHKLILWSTIYNNAWEFEYNIPDKATALEKAGNNLLLFGDYVRLFNNGEFTIIDVLNSTIEPGMTCRAMEQAFYKDNNNLKSFGSPFKGLKRSVQTLLKDCGSDGAVIPVMPEYHKFLVSKSPSYLLYYNIGYNGATAETIWIDLGRMAKINFIKFYMDELESNDGIDISVLNSAGSLISDTITYSNNGNVNFAVLRPNTTVRNLQDKIYFTFNWSSYSNGDLKIHAIEIDYDYADYTA